MSDFRESIARLRGERPNASPLVGEEARNYIADALETAVEARQMAEGAGGGSGGGSTVAVIDQLTSTSQTAALSANMGRVLNERIQASTPTNNVGVWHPQINWFSIHTQPLEEGALLDPQPTFTSAGSSVGTFVRAGNVITASFNLAFDPGNEHGEVLGIIGLPAPAAEPQTVALTYFETTGQRRAIAMTASLVGSEMRFTTGLDAAFHISGTVTYLVRAGA